MFSCLCWSSVLTTTLWNNSNKKTDVRCHLAQEVLSVAATWSSASLLLPVVTAVAAAAASGLLSLVSLLLLLLLLLLFWTLSSPWLLLWTRVVFLSLSSSSCFHSSSLSCSFFFSLTRRHVFKFAFKCLSGKPNETKTSVETAHSTVWAPEWLKMISWRVSLTCTALNRLEFAHY